MWIIITYDVSTETAKGRRRLRNVARACTDYGQRVQKSVFECSVNQVQYEKLRSKVLKCINQDEDSLRFYHMQEPRKKYVEEYGCKQIIDFDDTLII